MPEKRFDTAVVPMLIQRPHAPPAFHPQWAHALGDGWEPLGTTHEVEAIAQTEDQGTPGEAIRIIFGLLKRPVSAILLPGPGVTIPSLT